MKWIKKGLILVPDKFGWMFTHAQNPFPESLGQDFYKIYFASRDDKGMSRTGFVVINIKCPKKILEISQKPILDLGDLGCFDDCGVMSSCLLNVGNKKYLYYSGWKQEVLTPFSFFIGLAISEDAGKTFSRYSKAPVFGRTKEDPYLTAMPWVIIENDIWRMWYVSCTGWEIVSGSNKPKHYYHIRYAESQDGFNWKSEGTVCVDFRKDEYAIARPVVYREDSLYKMWYCHRGGIDTYRAGYAESKDGISWTRKDDQVGIDVSPSSWDSDMICYPCVFGHQGEKYMLYNGNGYGKTGFGLAILED